MMGRYWDTMGNLVDHIQLLYGNLVNLVENVDAGHVNAVSLDDIDQILSGRIVSQRYISIMNFGFG
jgi:hypothetical protein